MLIGASLSLIKILSEDYQKYIKNSNNQKEEENEENNQKLDILMKNKSEL